MIQGKLRPTERTALVTHRGCLDGTGSALMFIWAGGLAKNVLFRTPSACNLTSEEAAPFDEVIFADLCPHSEGSELGDDVAGGKPFHIYDHHVSNQKKYPADDRCTFSMKHSGTSLMACEFLPIMMPEGRYRLIEALEAYDLGRFDHADGQFLADLATTFDQEMMLNTLMTHGEAVFDDPMLVGRVMGAAAARQLYAQSAAKNARYFEFKPPGWGMASGIVDAGLAVSPVYWKNDVAEEILKKAELAIIVDPAGGMCSLRSRHLDCSSMAAAMGGGGHKSAAGFKINRDSLLSIIAQEVFE